MPVGNKTNTYIILSIYIYGSVCTFLCVCAYRCMYKRSGGIRLISHQTNHRVIFELFATQRFTHYSGVSIKIKTYNIIDCKFKSYECIFHYDTAVVINRCIILIFNFSANINASLG